MSSLAHIVNQHSNDLKMRIIFLVFSLLIVSLSSQAQKKQLLSTHEAVEQQAFLELAQAISPPDGSLYKFGIKNKIVGEYTFRLTLEKDGQVTSVFVVDKKNGNIESQNQLKDKIFDFQFDFKMPKKQDFKINYTFKF